MVKSKNFAGERSDYAEPLKLIIEKYNSLYGEDTYEQNSEKVNAILMEDGRIIRYHKFMPEMSSPRKK